MSAADGREPVAKVDSEWLRGVRDAASYAHEEYADTVGEHIIISVVAREVLRQMSSRPRGSSRE